MDRPMDRLTDRLADGLPTDNNNINHVINSNNNNNNDDNDNDNNYCNYLASSSLSVCVMVAYVADGAYQGESQDWKHLLMETSVTLISATKRIDTRHFFLSVDSSIV